MTNRCEWCGTEEVYVKYHDKEWGVPVYDDQKLFEMLILEGAQAGLSWITILKRRETYRIAYNNFDPKIIVNWDDKKISELLEDPGIIRNKLKVVAAKLNAQKFLEIVEEYGSFKKYIWSFVEGKPIQNNFKKMADIPATSKDSDAMSKGLKKKGFKFVGSTICYAYMQSVGMVNDHVISCFRHTELQNS